MSPHISLRSLIPALSIDPRSATGRRRVLIGLLAAGALLGACTDPEAAPSQTLDVTEHPEATIAAAALIPGDTVVDRGITAGVPDRGVSVRVIAELEAGGAQTLTVATADDGRVTITRGTPSWRPNGRPTRRRVIRHRRAMTRRSA